MRRARAGLLAVLIALPLAAQTDSLTQAQQVLAAALSAGADRLAQSLYDDAQWCVRFAQENWNNAKSDTREQARLRAEEATQAGRAALAKAQWLSSNLAITQLQTDIAKFGGSSTQRVEGEPSTIDYGRGTTLEQHIVAAQSAIDQAKSAGAEQIAGNDLKIAQDDLTTTRKIAAANKTSESADHLAYVAEMIARRAYYLARAGESSRNLPALQLERTKLAQAASEQQVAADRARLEQGEKERAALQQQLAAEQANREQLRLQLEQSQREAAQRAEADRQARLSAEQQLDQLNHKYQAAIASGNVADVETLRRQVEDQQIALRAIQERERLNEQSLSSEIESLRTQLNTAKQQGTESSQALVQRQTDLARRTQELQALQKEREADLAHRTEVERQTQAAIADAQRRRQEAEAQALQLRSQLEQAQQQAAAAQRAAQQQVQQTQSELDKSRQELDRVRAELASKDAETRRLRMQQELSKIATTKSTDRGLVMSLSTSTLFASGKTALKPSAKKTLQKIADQLKGESGSAVSVEGLSDKRAAAVRDFLVNAGVGADRVAAPSAGRQSKPRVELIITNR
ncbi:MAG TPA: DUF4398 domain-containing protein [Thermoanaerobaculia bacterium]|nr:DUF4398 domain-containing protein [Thermoanaerobaculia bacterium]